LRSSINDNILCVYRAKRYHEPEKGTQIQAMFFNRYDIGEVEVRRGLDMCYASIAMRDARQMPSATNRNEMTNDMFTIFKLMPIATKVDLFCKFSAAVIETDNSDPSIIYVRDLLVSALLSDVADELKVFLSYVKSKSLTRMKVALGIDGRTALEALHMGPWLCTLNFLRDYKFSVFTGIAERVLSIATVAGAAAAVAAACADEAGEVTSPVSTAMPPATPNTDPAAEPAPIPAPEPAPEAAVVPAVTAAVDPTQDSSSAAAPATASTDGAVSPEASTEPVVAVSVDAATATPETDPAVQAPVVPVEVPVIPDTPQLQALIRLVLSVCVVANKLDVVFLKEHVFTICYQLLRTYKADLTMEAYNAMKNNFIATQAAVVVGDGTDPFGLKQQSYYFNHWFSIDNLILEDSDLTLPYYDAVGGNGALLRTKLPQLDEPGEFERLVALFAGRPVYHVDEDKRHKLYPPYLAAAKEKDAVDRLLAEDKSKPSRFSVRGELFEQ
jgi:hypothetical protein